MREKERDKDFDEEFNLITSNMLFDHCSAGLIVLNCIEMRVRVELGLKATRTTSQH